MYIHELINQCEKLSTHGQSYFFNTTNHCQRLTKCVLRVPHALSYLIFTIVLQEGY